MVAELRIGIIGLGARSAIAANLARTGLGARLVGGADPDPQMRARAARAFGEHLAWVEDTDQLLAAGIDAAIVTSPDDTHEAITCALLEAGAAVYLEKPIAITIEGADRVLETAYRTGTPLYVGHNMRHMAVVRTLRDVIRQGTIGQVKAIWCRHFVGNGGDYYFKDWHADRSRTTGLLLQKAAHDIDVMNWLSDSVPARVVAMGDLMVYGSLADRAPRPGQLMQDWFSFDNWPPESLTGLNPTIDVEDMSMLLMRQVSGAMVSYEQCHFTPDYWRNYTVIGTRGRAENFGDGQGGVVRVWTHRRGYDAKGGHRDPAPGGRRGPRRRGRRHNGRVPALRPQRGAHRHHAPGGPGGRCRRGPGDPFAAQPQHPLRRAPRPPGAGGVLRGQPAARHPAAGRVAAPRRWGARNPAH